MGRGHWGTRRKHCIDAAVKLVVLPMSDSAGGWLGCSAGTPMAAAAGRAVWGVTGLALGQAMLRGARATPRAGDAAE